MKKKDDIDEALIKAYMNNRTVNQNLYKATSSEYYYVTDADYKEPVNITSEKSRRSLKDLFSFSFISSKEKAMQKAEQEMNDLINPNKMYEKLGVDVLCLRLGSHIIFLADPDAENKLLPKIASFRVRMAEKLGYIIPNVRIQDDPLLNENEYQILVRGKEVFRAELTSENICNFDIQPILSELEEVCIKYVHQIMEKTNILKIMELVRAENPTLVNDLVPLFISATDLKTIFANLISKRISVKDVIYIFEILNNHARYVYDLDTLTDILIKELNFDYK